MTKFWVGVCCRHIQEGTVGLTNFYEKMVPLGRQISTKMIPLAGQIRSRLLVLNWKIQRSTYSFYQFLLKMFTMNFLLSKATKDKSMAIPLPNMIPFARPKLPKCIPLARLEVQKSRPSSAAHPHVTLLWKNTPVAHSKAESLQE